MNKEVEKAMRRGKRVNPVKEWWSKNDYKVLRVIFFPLWIYQIIQSKSNKWANARQEWDEKRAAEILSYYIPRVADWNGDHFWFFDNGYGWSHSKRKVKRKDRRFWKVWANCWGGEIRKYLIEKFELDGFTKEVEDTYDNFDTEIVFYRKKEEI